MKQFIVLMAVLPLLLLFMLQMSLDQMNYVQMGRLADAVYIAKEQARAEGCFSEEVTGALRERIAAALSLSPEDVCIEASAEPVPRMTAEGWRSEGRGLIHYRVSVPAGRHMACPGLAGLSEEENAWIFSVDSCTPSEWVSGEEP